MKTPLIIIIVIIVLVVGGWLAFRFIAGGIEDIWICKYETNGGVWVKNGNPATASPKTACVAGKEAGLPQVSANEAFTNFAQYDGKEICITGEYSRGSETSDFVTPTGFGISVEDAIVGVDSLQCTQGSYLCSGIVTACGIFLYAQEGERKFGHQFLYSMMIISRNSNEWVCHKGDWIQIGNPGWQKPSAEDCKTTESGTGL